MATKFAQGIKQDLAEYKQKRAAIEKKMNALEKELAALDKDYELVLSVSDFLGKKKPGPKKAGKRAKRGQTKELVIGALKSSKTPLKPREIIEAVGGKVSGPSVRQQLMKLKKEGTVVQDKDKNYRLKGGGKTVPAKKKTKKAKA